MSNLPTPPTPGPRSPTASATFRRRGMDAPPTGAWMREGPLPRMSSGCMRSRRQSIALVLANLVAMIWFIEGGHFALYLVGFVLLFAIVVIARVRIGTLFLKLGEVVSQDCDPARYRAVLDVLSARDRFGRSANTIAIELAYCDYLELDSAGALRRLESVTFKRKDNIRWFRAMQIEFLSRIDVGDLDGCTRCTGEALCVSEELQGGLAQPCLRRHLQVADYAVLVRPSAERDAADAARMRERMALADCHQQRANWKLYLAEYELLHGSPEEAARLAGDPQHRAAHAPHGAPPRRGAVGDGGERVMEYAVFRLAVEYLPHTGYGAIVERG